MTSWFRGITERLTGTLSFILPSHLNFIFKLFFSPLICLWDFFFLVFQGTKFHLWSQQGHFCWNPGVASIIARVNMWHFMMYFMASDNSTFHSNVTWGEINKVCGRAGNGEYSNVCIISVEVKVLLILTQKQYK